MNEAILRVRKKGVTIIPKNLREAAGIAEDSEVKAKVLPEGILLRPFMSDPVGTLENLSPARVRGSSVNRIRKLRKMIDRETRG